MVPATRMQQELQYDNTMAGFLWAGTWVNDITTPANCGAHSIGQQLRLRHKIALKIFAIWLIHSHVFRFLLSVLSCCTLAGPTGAGTQIRHILSRGVTIFGRPWTPGAESPIYGIGSGSATPSARGSEAAKFIFVLELCSTACPRPISEVYSLRT